MPTYVYRCSACQHQFEEMQKITASPLTTCPKCQKASLQRIPSGGIGLNFVGSGFYQTDYAPSKPPEGSCCPCGKKPKDSCKSN